MQRFTYLLAIVLICGCHQRQIQENAMVNNESVSFTDNEVIALPIELILGSGSIGSTFGGLSRRQPLGFWKDLLDETTGIPEGWDSAVVKRIEFDYAQFYYQSLLLGRIDSTRINKWIADGSLDFEGRKLSTKPLGCYTHVLIHQDEEGNNLFKLDTDNDRDFSDERAVIAPRTRTFGGDISLHKAWIDSLWENTGQLVQAEVLIDNQPQSVQMPVIIVATPSGFFWYAVPVHSKTFFMGETIWIRPTSGDYHQFSHLFIGQDPGSLMWSDRISKNEFLLIDDQYFENLGVDFNQQVLKLKKVSSDTTISAAVVNFQAPRFYAKAFETDSPLTLEHYAGKYLFMEFWGTWCAPCIKEIPNLQNAYSQLDTSKVAFLGVAEDDPERLRAFLLEEEIPWPQIVADTTNALNKLYNIQSWPRSFLINPEGIIVAKNIRGEGLLDTLNYYLDQSFDGN